MDTLKCGRIGLGDTLRFGFLGGYDGAHLWTLASANFRGGEEQRMTELHEWLHHELQSSSPWGLVSAMAWLLSNRGFRKHALSELFQVMVTESQNTHEVFATTLSATWMGIDRAHDLLRGNSDYRAYLNRGLALVDPADAQLWQFHHAAMNSAISVCMRPAGAFGLLARGFRDLTRWDLDREHDSPDRRLEAFERHGGPSSWGPVFRELLEQHPDRGGDTSTGPGRAFPEDPDELDRLRRFEEEILLPRCHAHVCDVLAEAGFDSISVREQSRLANAAVSAVAEADADLADQFELIKNRRPIFEEAGQYDRQQVLLRERLPVKVVDERDTTHNLDWFRMPDGASREYACAMWIDRDVARKQFAFADDVELPDPVTALVAVVDAPDGRFIRLGLLSPEATPQVCQQMLGPTPLVVLSTHATLSRHAQALALLQTITPTFVLMDLPVARHVGHWVSQGAVVRVHVHEVDHGDARLTVAELAIGRQHPFVFLLVGFETGTAVLIDQLRRRHPNGLDETATDIDEAVEYASGLAVNLVLNSWHLLDRRGWVS